MRLLVHGPTLAGDPRMRTAAAGLILRGHQVLWMGEPPPVSGLDVIPVERRRDVTRRGEPVDLLLGGAGRLWPSAWTAWRIAARGRVLGLGHAAGWPTRALDRWALEATVTTGMVVGGTPGIVPHEGRNALWAWSAEPPPSSPSSAHPDTEQLERACESTLARSQGGPRAAAFLDRDGTLVVEKNHLSDPDALQLIDGVAGALARLHAAGFALILVSNQSGVGRGYFSLERAHEIMARLRVELRRAGVELDAIYLCPHAPEAGCPCRKPGSQLLRDAARNQNLVLSRSAMVGDKMIDVQAGHAAGARAVLVRTGYGRAEATRESEAGRAPHFVADDLAAAAAWLLQQGLGRD